MKGLKPGQPILTVNSLKRKFGDRVVLSDITFSLQPGDRVGVLGVNGAGKTSLLRALAGELRPRARRLEVLGLDPRRARGADLAGAIGIAKQVVDRARVDDLPTLERLHRGASRGEQRLVTGQRQGFTDRNRRLGMGVKVGVATLFHNVEQVSIGTLD